MKRITAALGIALILASSAVQAIPTLFFDGTVNYNTGSTAMSVDATLIDTVDVTPAPTLAGSTMLFTTYFDSVATISGGCFFCATSIKGDFVGDADALVDDLSIVDGGGTTLLTAKINNLSMEGAVGDNFGVITSTLSATGGSLLSTFDGSELFALQLNLDTIFSSRMYESDFSGRVDGHITASSVPEPSILSLLGFGLLISVTARKIK